MVERNIPGNKAGCGRLTSIQLPVAVSSDNGAVVENTLQQEEKQDGE